MTLGEFTLAIKHPSSRERRVLSPALWCEHSPSFPTRGEHGQNLPPSQRQPIRIAIVSVSLKNSIYLSLTFLTSLTVLAL